MKRYALRTALLLAWIGSSTALVDAHPSEAPAPIWKSKTTSVTVFKNGFGFFTREGEVRLLDGWGHAAEVPPATFGTFAIYSQDPAQLVDLVGTGDGELVAFDDPSYDSKPDRQKALESALNTSVHLQYKSGTEEKECTGILKGTGGGYAIVELGDSATAVPLESIVSMRRMNLPLRFHVVQEDGSNAAASKVQMAYLRSGIVWIPEYTLKLLDDETAELTLRGSLVNEAEDLIDCDVNFVVGVPHFVHSNLLSPVAVGHAIRAIGSAVPSGSIPQQVMSQVMNRAAIANSHRSSQFNDGSTPELPSPDGSSPFSTLLSSLPQADTAGSGDYTVYSKKKITVRKGERAMVTLMTTRIRYGHTYSWRTDQDVKHMLTLENSSQLPWTTGPCLAISGNYPLSEDILKYTPVQGRGELNVTTAINVAKKASETEVARQLKAHEPQTHQHLDLVTLEGKILLRSFEKKPIEITITQGVQGKPVEASDNGAIRIDTDRLRLVERTGTIQWKVQLEPGKEREISYKYERYVPSN